MLEAFQAFTDGLPEWIRWAAVVLVAVIPFVESYFGTAIGIAAGVHPLVAIAAACLGNFVSMVAFVSAAHVTRTRVVSGRDASISPKRARLRRMFDKYGVAVVSLIGQTVLPSQITSAAMVSFGAPKKTVIMWQTVSILLWSVVFALATLGVFAAIG